MQWLSLIILFPIGVVSAIYIYFKRKYSYWKDRGVPHLEPKIPIGNISLKNVAHVKDLFQTMYELKRGVPFVGAYVTVKPIVVATGLDFVQDVLVKYFSNFHARGIYTNEQDDPLSAHMFSLDGPKWKMLRTKLSPTFTSGKMKFMFATVVEVATEFDETLNEMVKLENVLDVKDLLARFTTDVIGTCAFGLECNSLKDPNAEFRKYGRMVFEAPRLGGLARWLTQYHWLARKLHIKTINEQVTDFFLGVVRQTIEHREKNNIKRKDFMDLLINLKNNDTISEDSQVKLSKLSVEQIAAQAFLFFLAGFETSSTTMMFCLYELALNPEIQEKARDTIHAVLEKHDGKMTYEAIKDMSYLYQIIHETLRKYPPVISLRRIAQEDFKVPNSTLIIQKGTPIVIPTYSIHHDERYYPNPENFDPDRFLPDAVQSRHPMTFLGFGDGPRNCIGLRFGRLQAMVGLATLLNSYRFSVCDKTPVPMVFSKENPILSPVDGLHLKVERI